MVKLNSKLTVSIVNFNSGVYLLRCLESLEQVSDEVSLEIFVVDNNSSDDSFSEAKRKFTKINFIETGENLGFGSANNLVLKKLKTEFCLILNPDTEVKSGVLGKMVSFMEENLDVGVATCKVLLENGTLDWASHRGFPTPFASLLYFMGNDSLYHLSNRPMDKSHEVDSISGAFFLTRKSVLDKVGGFDEDFFLYGEDLDLCFRIRSKGFKVVYVPEVSIIHHKGVSSGLKKQTQEISTADLETKIRSLNAFYNAMKIFYRKHLEKNYPTIINWLVYLGIYTKKWLVRRSMSV